MSFGTHQPQYYPPSLPYRYEQQIPQQPILKGRPVASIEEALVKGDKVQLIGFGTFEAKQREAREGRNPRTGETIQIAASTVPVFKASKSLKDTVNK